MKPQSIIIISLICFLVVAVFTIGTFAIKPKMHKTIMLEQIIYKRTK